MRTSPWDWQGELVSAGIECVADGWYRCWLWHDEYQASINAKAGTYTHAVLSLDTAEAVFNLETGDVTPRKGLLSAWDKPPEFKVSFPSGCLVEEGKELFVHGPQLERWPALL